MQNERKLVCIECPKGCLLSVRTENERILEISGYCCMRGKQYVAQEMINPVRIVTSTVIVKNGTQRVLPVRTREGIPKTMIFECIRQIKSMEVEAPVKAGDIVLRNFKGTGIDIIATKTIEYTGNGEKNVRFVRGKEKV